MPLLPDFGQHVQVSLRAVPSRALRDNPGAASDGFTLIELLVVIVILGILSALSAATFFRQRDKGWDASAKSDVRNGATYQESYLADHDVYANTAQLIAEGWVGSGDVRNLTVVS